MLPRERQEASPAAKAALSFALPPHVPAGLGANFENASGDPVIDRVSSALNRAKSDAELMLEAARAGMQDPTRTASVDISR